MHERFRGPALQSPDRPDAVFALIAGLYAAILLSPAVVLALGAWVTSEGGFLYMGLLATVTVLTAGLAWAITKWRGLPERLGASRLCWGLSVLPLAVAFGYLALTAAIDTPGDSAGGAAGFALGIVGMFISFGLVAMARNRYAAAIVDEDAVTCQWRAGWPTRQRRPVQAVAIAGMLAYVGGLAADTVWSIGWLYTVAQLLFIPAIALVSLGQERTYRTTPAGIERRYPAVKNVYGWDEFEGYSVTDEALVLHWRAWWRIDIRCAWADIDDREAVEAAVAEHLPQA